VAVALVEGDPGLEGHRQLVDELRIFIEDSEAEFLFKS
jgi:hypothetical protein